jgi:serine protease
MTRSTSRLMVAALLSVVLFAGCVGEGDNLSAIFNPGENAPNGTGYLEAVIPGSLVDGMVVGQDGILESADPVAGQYIVQFKDEVVAPNSLSPLFLADDVALATDMVLSQANVRAELMYVYDKALTGFAARMTREEAAALLKNPAVKSVSQDSEIHLLVTWGQDRIDQASLPLNNAYNPPNRGAGVQAYIIDSGVLLAHSEFSGRMGTGYAYDGGSANAASGCEGHGTHVAGTVGGATYGIANQVTIRPIRVFPCTGSTSNANVIAGINWMIGDHTTAPAVANLSLGNNAISDNITMVVAAGNDALDACTNSPARVPNAITVGATNRLDARADFSNWGSCLDIFAPGQEILSAWNGNTTEMPGCTTTCTMDGTSMAAPHVAGVAAIYLSANQSATPAQVRTALVGAGASNKIGSTSSFGYSGIAGAKGAWLGPVPLYANNPTFAISGGTGDADLYVKKGAAPTKTVYDCRPYAGGNSESCVMTGGQGTYYAAISVYTAISGVTLTASGGGSMTGSINLLLQSGVTSGTSPVCGDRVCNGTETCSTCAGDCGSCTPVCGDKVCNGTETCSTCPGDCGACAPVCGDKVCNGTETCSTCPGDCGACSGTCPGAFSASNTNSAQQNTVNSTVNLTANTTYTIQTCGTGSGDTYLRLYNSGGSQMASGDDGCTTGTATKFTYKPTTTAKYTIKAGCYSSYACSGTISISPAATCP